jgi:hypothetical protein
MLFSSWSTRLMGNENRVVLDTRSRYFVVAGAEQQRPWGSRFPPQGSDGKTALRKGEDVLRFQLRQLDVATRRVTLIVDVS